MRPGRISLPAYLTPLFKTPYSEVFKIRIPDNDSSVAEIKYARRAKFPIMQKNSNSGYSSPSPAEGMVSFAKSVREKLTRNKQSANEIEDDRFSREDFTNLSTLQTVGLIPEGNAKGNMSFFLANLNDLAQEVLMAKDIDPGRVLDLLR